MTVEEYDQLLVAQLAHESVDRVEIQNRRQHTMTTTRTDLREHGRIILAHGEVTGHCHEVIDAATGLPPGLDVAQFFEAPDGTRQLIVLAPCALRHDEHAPIPLDPAKPVQWRQGDVLGQPTGAGTWRIIRQREGYQPDAWRQVAD